MQLSFDSRWLVAAALMSACKGEQLRIEPLALPAGIEQGQSADPALAVDPASGDLLLAWAGGGEPWSLLIARSAGRRGTDRR